MDYISATWMGGKNTVKYERVQKMNWPSEHTA